LIVVFLMACTPESDPVDTSPPLDTGREVEDPSVRAATLLDAAEAPAAAWRRAWIWRSNGSTDCPTAYDAGNGTTRIGGDCTDDDGVTWGGTLDTLEIAAGRKVTFNDWSRADATGVRVWTGEIVLPADDGLVATFTERDAAGALTRAWSRFTTAPWTAWEIADQGGAAAWTVEGALTVGSALDTVSGGVTELGACGLEPDDGGLTFSGFDQVTFDFDGDTSCDGCLPFTDPSGAHTLCR
jgi:hypothetical protein